MYKVRITEGKSSKEGGLDVVINQCQVQKVRYNKDADKKRQVAQV